MSHAVYHFLMAVDLTESEEEIKCEIEGLFEDYGQTHCDENNWWTILDAISKDGRRFVFADESEGEVSAQWNEALRYAAQCVATDMALFDAAPYFGNENNKKIEEATLADIVNAIHHDIPKRLASMYSEVKSPPPSPDYLDGYQRKRMAMQYECFRSAKLPPFSTDSVSPYEYRAHDLTDTRTGNVILRVDIHT